MKKHSLGEKGLSLSQAQTLSNLCFQRTQDIQSQLSGLNNYEKSIMIDGQKYIDVPAKAMPKNIVELLTEKAQLHGTQAFLMENIKAKTQLIQNKQNELFTTELTIPVRKERLVAEMLPIITEEQGWESLTAAEYNDFLESEAFAAHFGQFIHKDMPLDRLRKELPNIKTLEWAVIKEGEKTPMAITIHHTQEDLLKVHEELAGLHRKHEQRVNYFKAKVKNYVTDENQKIAKKNKEAQNVVNAENDKNDDQYSKEYREYTGKILAEKQAFENTRLLALQEFAALRIQVDPRFQKTVDRYLELITDK